MGTDVCSGNEQQYFARMHALHEELGVADKYHDRRLPLHYEPRDLVVADTGPDGKPVELEAEAARKWREMKKAAARDGVELLAEFGFRSLEEQASLIRQHLEQGEDLSEVLCLLAAPGYSEHHTGRAIDIGCPCCYPPLAKEEFERTEAFRWLLANAKNYGFVLSYPAGNPHGLRYEPWHWYFWDSGT